MGWFSKIEQPLVRDLSIGVWRLFSDLDLSEAKKTEFNSMHDCFIRELKDGARPIDPDPAVLVSPCDAIVGACGRDRRHASCSRSRASPTRCRTCSAIRELVERYRDGRYVTLRLTSSMYHRFHAPHDCRVEQVTYISGDTWNVNPIALQAHREAVLQERARRDRSTRLAASGARRHAGAGGRDPGRQHPAALPRRAAAPAIRGAERHRLRCARFRKGEEMGWFEHGSTIIVLAPGRLSLLDTVQPGRLIRMGEALAQLA